MKNKRLVSVCIPSLNTLGYLKDCIAALKKSTKVPIEILVLDLGDDGTFEWCKKHKIQVWKKSLPFYFAQSNNFLAQKARGDVLLFLNPDTIPQQGFLEAMLEDMDKEEAAIEGCLITYPNNIVQHAGITWRGIYPHLRDLPEHIRYMREGDMKENFKSCDVKAITGACLLIKKHVFFNLGMFDEQFRNCYEDVDLCIKATTAGYRIRYCGKAKILHYVSGSKGTDGKSSTSGEYMEEAKQRLFAKYENPPLVDESGKPHIHKIQDEGYMSTIIKNNASWQHRILIGTPTTGTVRMEWVLGRYGQVIPTNWSFVDMMEWIQSYAPLEYLVPDAQNLIVRHALQQGFEWLLLYEQDDVPMPDAFIRLNQYMLKGDVPIVSGLYFTKSDPPEPLVYRGRGNSYYSDWKMGDLVWADGVPTGFLLINCRILKAMWDESPEYMVGGTMTRRVFECPRKIDIDANGAQMVSTGTSDLEFCSAVMKRGILAKAGYGDFAKEHPDFPFLVDTGLFCWHIDSSGRKFPLGGIPEKFRPLPGAKKNETVLSR